MTGRPGKYQPRFTSGELDPLSEGNTDQADYFKGAALMRNVRPNPQGGFSLMWGTKKFGRARTAGGGAVSPISIRKFTRSQSSIFDVVFTDGWADIYGANGVLASVATPWTGQLQREMTDTQQLDTMLLCHENVKPKRLRRMVDDLTWVLDDAPFVNLPNYDYGGVYANGVASAWLINFFNFAGGNHYVLSVNAQDSTAQTYGGAEAANINAALVGIAGIFPGITTNAGPVVTPSGVNVPAGFYSIEFTGAGNQGDGWAVSGRALDNGNAAIPAAHVRAGVLPGEPIMSVAQGWPQAIILYDGRGVIGGFKNAPNVMLPSQKGNYFNLDTRLTSAAAPFVLPLDADGAAKILHLHRGRTLFIFTDSGEYWLSTPTLDKTAPPTIVNSTTHGAARVCRPVENEGATYFVAVGGSFHEMRYDFNQQNYAAPNIAVRASSLVRDIVDMTLRKPQKATDTAQFYLLRADGVIAVGHILAAEDIRAFTRRETDGAFAAVNINDRREATFAVVRDVGGVATQFIERETENYILDCAQNFNLGAPGLVVGGLDDFAGAEIWAVADNVPQGPFVVPTIAPFQITLNYPATSGYVGRWTPPRVLTLPVPRAVAPNTVVRRPCRVHTVRLLLKDTTSVAIGANNDAAFDVPLTTFGAPADVPLLLSPFSGWVACEGLDYWTEDGTVEITQKFPGLLTVLGIVTEVDY
jgi:hypothetical protein